MIGRRGVLVAGLAALAAPAVAQVRPRARPDRSGSGVEASCAALIEAARLGGEVGYVVADLASGAVLAQARADRPLPPASVTKAVTALFARQRLGTESGAGHRFVTRIMATGPVRGGVLQGDLIFVGGGDPSLDTDRLGDMARALAQAGVRAIAGRFFIWANALPLIAQIDDGQPDYVGYNPTISGVMLNFNRAQFVWAQEGGARVMAINAEGARFNPPVRVIEVVAAERVAPLFRYEARRPRERWSVAAPALNKAGSRWLPVRNPLAYLGDVFATLCAGHGIDLPAAAEIEALPDGAQTLVEDRSEVLDKLLRGMLRFSTNVTAEAIGLAASQGGDLRASAGAMSDWASAQFGTAARFVDHSGLGAGSSCTPLDMLAIVQGAKGLDTLLREKRIDGQGREAKDGAIRILAKSGTLNFTSNLAGYAALPSGRVLAFAIFAADTPRRAALPLDQREDPPGGSAWIKRAHAMQRQMIATWAKSWA